MALVKAALELGGKNEINILVHNAGHGDDCYLPDITEDFYQIQTDINMKGIIPTSLLSKSIIPDPSSANISHPKGYSTHAALLPHRPNLLR